MNNISVDIGRICFSNQGRDKDKCFAIVGIIDDNYVWIADGVTRKLSSPKKKKLKHLDLKPVVLESIANKLIENKKVFDSELRSAIQNTQYFKKV